LKELFGLLVLKTEASFLTSAAKYLFFSVMHPGGIEPDEDLIDSIVYFF
jgi:hypothetical protein